MIDRRSFFKAAGAGAAASLVAACGWDGGGTVKPALLSISRLNDWVGEHLLFSPSRLAPNYDPSRR
ncbi:MAG TPA: twin-arginine translocation signal domain-containing protein, partial [Gemmatimonadales bacterium]|nr:twin-arginine translocation signal domain-containing protein [Gemmatimonadales bacterium]